MFSICVPFYWTSCRFVNLRGYSVVGLTFLPWHINFWITSDRQVVNHCMWKAIFPGDPKHVTHAQRSPDPFQSVIGCMTKLYKLVIGHREWLARHLYQKVRCFIIFAHHMTHIWCAKIGSSVLKMLLYIGTGFSTDSMYIALVVYVRYSVGDACLNDGEIMFQAWIIGADTPQRGTSYLGKESM